MEGRSPNPTSPPRPEHGASPSKAPDVRRHVPHPSDHEFGRKVTAKQGISQRECGQGQMGEALQGQMPPSHRAARPLRSLLTLLRAGNSAFNLPAREGRPPPPANHTHARTPKANPRLQETMTGASLGCPHCSSQPPSCSLKPKLLQPPRCLPSIRTESP